MAWGLVMDNSLSEEEFEDLVDIIVGLDKKDFFIWFFEHKDNITSNSGLDPLLVGSYLCQLTSYLQIGLILDPFIRPASWLAKNLVTTDLICKGRLHVGLQFSQLAHRQFLEQTIKVFNGLFEGGPFSFEGQSITLDKAMSLPLPWRKTNLPLWVQGQFIYEMRNMVEGLITIGNSQSLKGYNLEPDSNPTKLKHFLILEELNEFTKVSKSLEFRNNSNIFGIGLLIKHHMLDMDPKQQLKIFLNLIPFGQ